MRIFCHVARSRHTEYRESLELVLSTTKDIVLAHQFGTADQCLHVLEHDAPNPMPDLILLDLNLPGLNGIDALPLLKKHTQETPIIVLTQSDREADVLAAISAGASGYLLKSSTGDQLINGIRGGAEGRGSDRSEGGPFHREYPAQRTAKNGTTKHALGTGNRRVEPAGRRVG